MRAFKHTRLRVLNLVLLVVNGLILLPSTHRAVTAQVNVMLRQVILHGGVAVLRQLHGLNLLHLIFAIALPEEAAGSGAEDEEDATAGGASN